MLEDLRLLLRLGALSRARALLGLLALALVGAALEVLGVGLVFPLIALLDEPERIGESALLSTAYEWVGAGSTREFLVLLVLAMGAVFLAKSLYMVLLSRAETRFLARWRSETTTRLMRAYLYTPYARISRHNSAGPVRAVASLAPKLFDGFVRSMLALAVNAIMALGIFAVIGVAKPVVIGIAALVLPMLFLQHRLFRRHLLALGSQVAEVKRDQQKSLHESFGALKETKILGREPFFLERFATAERVFTDNRRRMHFLQTLPPIFTEAILMAAVLALVMAVLLTEPRSGSTLASLGLLAAASFRLAPLCSRMLVAANSIHYGRAAARIVVEALEAEPAAVGDAPPPPEEVPADVLRRELALEAVCFRYPGSRDFALRDVTLAIAAGESVGFVGPSGAGKTTLADLVLGLFEPTSGAIRADGRVIHGRSPSWRRAVGYVAQSVYILDDSVRRNVGFGLDEAAIDDARVWAALELAQVADVVRGLPGGLDARLGENGARLSAGQRQRIGIARALYPDPSLLVLDEATSALDGQTEGDLASAIRRIKGRKTLIVIAHRRATLEMCDRLVFLRDGRVEAIRSSADAGARAALAQAAESAPRLVGAKA